MLATISASSLNVRSLPSSWGKVLGVLPSGSVVDVVSEPESLTKSWAEIRFREQIAFVYGAYLQPVKLTQKLSGLVSTSLLNVRDSASTASVVLGTLTKGVIVRICGQAGTWFEIEFNGGLGYVSSQYIEPFYGEQNGYHAMVITSLLNVRATAYRRGAVLGRLHHGSKITVELVHGNWGQIRFNGTLGFVNTDYIQRIDTPDDNIPIDANDDVDHTIPKNETIDQDIGDPLVPSRMLEIVGSPLTRKVAATWNRFGGLLEELCESKNIDPAAAVAVLCVESSGKGFEQNNQNRMIIRFENHKFWRYWGRHNSRVFNKHFRYNTNKVWTRHEWASSSDNWQTFHGNQAKEWQVLEFAEQLDREAARMSISMGAPQIMGFHYERIGYDSVNEMFNAFSQDMGAQIRGLFDFFSKGMITDLRTLDFEGFAGAYNGSGQKQKYGKLINEHYRAFKSIYR